MSDVLENLGPSLPSGVLYPVSVLLTCQFAWICWWSKSRIATFVLFAIWVRYMMSAFHTFTFTPSPIGLSWNALGSSAIFCLGLCLIKLKTLRLQYFLPIYAVGTVILISGIANHEYGGTINALVKYGYFLVVAIGVSEALAEYGEQRFVRLLLWTFAPLLVFQLLSIVLGISKVTEADGSESFIGGYNHEAAFSIALATAFVVASFAKDINAIVKGGVLLACLIGLLFANYRTAILAIVPMMVTQFALGATEAFPKKQRAAVGLVMGFACFAFVVIASFFLAQRFGDIGIVVETSGDVIKPPIDFTRSDIHLLSGRAYIWSQYLYGYADGTELQKLIGFGANSWEKAFGIYAHNTLISQLYEYGVMGVIALLYLLGSMFMAALRVPRGPRAKLLAASLSFILLSFATMPLWMIEGYIFYALVCGYTLYLLRPVRVKRGTLIVERAPASVGRRPALGMVGAGRHR